MEYNNQTNLRDLKETLGLVEKYSKRFYRYTNILNKGKIEKQEVINLKSILGGHKRNNLTDGEMTEICNKFLYPITPFDDLNKNQLLISKEHTAQGLKYLRSLYLTLKGKRKKVNGLNQLISTDAYYLDAKLVEYVIDNFSHFQFNGFMETFNGYRNTYEPVWLTVAKDGQTFEYVQQFSGYYGG